MLVYLADLGHNQLTKSSDVYPLGVANLAAYAAAYFDRPERLTIRLYREPQDLKSALDDRVPDVLGLSSYSWNHHLSVSMARYARSRDPRVITLMGGPNFPLTADVQESFLRSMPEIDVAVRGPTYEGERALLNALRRCSDVACSRDELFAEPLAGSMWIDPRSNALVAGPEPERIRDLDEIPSPYRTGLLDAYFQTGYFPLLQIARGCPFSCTFCNSSPVTNSKIWAHSVEDVQQDLLYIAERVDRELPLCFADDNFGMYARDEEIADFLAHLQERYGWPKYIRTTTGKNRSERIIRVMRKVQGALPMTAAVQSLNPTVLSNIRRSNISLDAYAQIQQEVLAQGMQSYGELILCLPGETRESFMDAVRQLLETGVKRVSAHQLMLLHGAPLSTPESRSRYGFQTKFRLVARNIGRYLEEPVTEVEEMVVSTNTFSYDDYLHCRVFHLLLTIYYYEGNFEEAFELAGDYNVSPFDLVTTLQSLLPSAPLRVRQLIEDFLQESRDELFDTARQCHAWARENFDAVVTGELGGNLLSKYSMLGRFSVTADVLTFLESAVLAAVDEDDRAEARPQLDAAISYLRSVLLHVPFADCMAGVRHWTSDYDVPAWRDSGFCAPLRTHRASTPVRYSSHVEPQRKQVILNRLETFGEHPAGLGKFTRTMFATDLRRTVRRRDPEGDAVDNAAEPLPSAQQP